MLFLVWGWIDPSTKDSYGINLYTWQWNDIAVKNNLDTYEPFGVLAQEVELIMPSAVSIGKMGYKQVDYCQVYGVSKLSADDPAIEEK